MDIIRACMAWGFRLQHCFYSVVIVLLLVSLLLFCFILHPTCLLRRSAAPEHSGEYSLRNWTFLSDYFMVYCFFQVFTALCLPALYESSQVH